MTDRGKELEQLVRSIEKQLLPDTFSVTGNETLVGEGGITEAEFDIVIEGKVGSVACKWLIECRDRPSQGAAPGSWIEQLVGRKAAYDFDKVIAVSTCGYSQGARNIAEGGAITLRDVKKLQEISEDYGIINFRLRHIDVECVGEFVANTKIKKGENPPSFDSQPPSIKLRYPDEGSYLRISDFIKREVYAGFTEHQLNEEGRKPFTWHHPGPIQIMLNGGSYLGTELEIPVAVVTEYFYTPTLSVKSYREEDGAVIGDAVSLRFDAGEFIVRCSAIVTMKNVEIEVHGEVREIVNK